MRRRRVVQLLVVPFAVAAVAVGWLVWRGLEARTELTAAKAAVARLQPALARSDSAAFQRELVAATEHSARARALTSDPVWRLAGWLPWIGATPHAVTATAAAVDEAVREILPDLGQAASALSPAQLRTGDRINLQPLVAAAPILERAEVRLGSIDRELDGLDQGWVLGSVRDGVKSVRDLLGTTQATVHQGTVVAQVLPPMLGVAGIRRYLVVLQNNAEARGTGGLVGAFAVIEVSGGRPSLIRLGSNTELASATQPAVDLGSNFRNLFGNDPALWSNTNLSAHFPNAAQLQLAMWRKQYGQNLDGVIAADPVAFGYLLTESGPLQIPGLGAVAGSAFADLSMRAVYARFPLAKQESARNAYQQAVARLAIDGVLAAEPDAKALIRALGRASGERRILVYSNHPAEQALLAGTSVGGVVDATPGAFAATVIDNEAGNKLDYYLDRTLDYAPADCVGGPATITVTLRNRAPATGLPLYAAYRQDRGPTSTVAGRGGDGSTRVRVLVYTAVGAKLSSATLDNAQAAPVAGLDGADGGRPVYSLSVELKSGQSRVLVLRLIEPASSGDGARAWVGPLVRAPKTTVQAQSCR